MEMNAFKVGDRVCYRREVGPDQRYGEIVEVNDLTHGHGITVKWDDGAVKRVYAGQLRHVTVSPD